VKIPVLVAAATGVVASAVPGVDAALAIFGAPVGTYAGAAGGILLWLQRLDPGDRLGRWPSIMAHYIAGVAAAGAALAYWETLRHIPSGFVGLCIAWGLPYIIPGAASVLRGLPETLASWWKAKNGPPADKGNSQ
jgi:hypothetical protein